MDRLREYRALIAVIESSSFTAAAEQLGLPRSSLSTMISGLESRLSARLLHRTTRVVSPTEEGLKLAERARDLIDEAQSLEIMFKKGEAISGRVRMSMPGRIAHEIVIPALPELLNRNPDLLVDLRISDQRLDLVSEGLDLVLRVGMLEDSSLICRRIGELPFINCASDAYVAQHGMPATADDLETHKAVSYMQPQAGGWVRLDLGNEHKMLKASVVVDSTEGYIRAGLSGLGIISLPRFDVKSHLRSGALVEILPETPPEGSDMAILYPSRKYLPLRIEVVRDWMTDLVNAQVMLA